MSVVSKKRRLAKRAAIRSSQSVEMTPAQTIAILYDELTAVSQKQTRKLQPKKKKPYLPLRVFLKKKRDAREDKKEFRAERRKHKIENQRLLEKAQRLERRLAHLQRMERRMNRLAVKGNQ
jgi:hypothetical protein